MHFPEGLTGPGCYGKESELSPFWWRRTYPGSKGINALVSGELEIPRVWVERVC